MSPSPKKKTSKEELLKEENQHGVVLEVDINNELKTSFLSYAMSVIVSRALPDVRDGLKPVHRRILYAMNDLGVYSDRPHKKSARIVGDVIGKYHPHGDTAVYEAMVRMAQDFSFRYPLVDGQGNFGSIDGDGAAAMRYTEARLSKLSSEMLRELDRNTVDFKDNYDASESEPVVLPSRFPNLLVNGSSGIAVGMATNIPPHNLTEVISGTLALIDNPNMTIEELMKLIPAPDFPTGGTIIGVDQIRKAYLTGTGTLTIRAKVKVVKNNNRQEIIISEIPYQVNKTKMIERIAEICKNKIIDGVTDIRDESSNKNGLRVVLELRRDANSRVILNNLYRHTQLQSSFGINMIALVEGQPRLLNLKQVLEYYISHQIDVITRRTIFDLDKAKARLHIVNGLIIALANIDEVVAIIKSSRTNEEASNRMIEAFLLTEIQTRAILDMRLASLTGLQVEKLMDECVKLAETIEYLESILANDLKKRAVIKDEMSEIMNRFGDSRMSVIDYEGDIQVDEADLIPVEDVIITITSKGYAKRMGVDTYKAQKRGGRGIAATKMQSDDLLERVVSTSTHDILLFFTNLGKVYSLTAYQVPVFSRTAKGIPVVNLLNLAQDEQLAAVINVKSVDQEGFLMFATKRGMIKKTLISQFKNIRSNGIKAINLLPEDELIHVVLTDGSKDILLGASNGKAVRFSEDKIRPTNRSATGVKGIKVEGSDRLIALILVENDEDEILIITTKGYGKRTKAQEFREKGRNCKGVKFMNITTKTGIPVDLQTVSKESDLIIISDKGMVIRTHIDQISTLGRDTQGVKLINLSEGHIVSSSTIVPRSNDTEETYDENDDSLIEEESIEQTIEPVEDFEESNDSLTVEIDSDDEDL